MNTFLNLPSLASVHGEKVDQSLIFVHLFILIIGVSFAFFFVFTLLRFRKKRNPQANAKGLANKAFLPVEILIVCIEIFLLVTLSIPFWIENIINLPTDQNAVRIRVVAEQYAWNFHYPGEDGFFGETKPKLVSKNTNPLGIDFSTPQAKDDITTLNTFVIPINRPVILYFSSKDVVHGFWLPHMRLKQTITPGVQVTNSFTPTTLGEYEIVCAQLCGLGHYQMRGLLRVVSEEVYKMWLQEKKQALDEVTLDPFWNS